ncbi:MAG: hypothetical protein U5K00_00345 [Melioribacteraceae bacterium]|nr:hypothetical protein [Melioribacteraceae bacterium]
MEKRKHNYPKTRKPRKTDYSITFKLIEEFGEAELYKIWCDCNGMYGAAESFVKLTDRILGHHLGSFDTFRINSIGRGNYKTKNTRFIKQ